jgi:hypothetical protein
MPQSAPQWFERRQQTTSGFVRFVAGGDVACFVPRRKGRGTAVVFSGKTPKRTYFHILPEMAKGPTLALVNGHSAAIGVQTSS